MAVFKTKTPTKDGRCWFYKTPYKDIFGANKTAVSKKFLTKKEAEMAEREFLRKIDAGIKPNDMTFQDLYEKFLENRKGKVKNTTWYDYHQKAKYLKSLMPVKCTDFNIHQFEEWKKQVNATSICTRYKNDVYKFLKSIMNHGMDWYGLDFLSTYRKMTNFTDPNEPIKEMLFYTYDEFKLFVGVIDDLRWKCFFETLYYCGLRRGEARGLTWDNIDWHRKCLTINKQVVDNYQTGSMDNWIISSPKTRTSYRTIPICDVLYADLRQLYEEVSKNKKFNMKYFVFGFSDHQPFAPSTALEKRKLYADMAGVKHIRLHDFRHSCASLLINSGANITLVAKFLGHSKIEETLNTYSHMFHSALTDVINVMNGLS